MSDPRPDLPDIVDQQLAGLSATATNDLAAAASGADKRIPSFQGR